MSEGVKNVIVIIYNLYNLVCWKIFCFWVKSILGNYETTLYSYFLSGDIDWYGYRWTDVHCFSIVDHWWHYSIGDELCMDQIQYHGIERMRQKSDKIIIGNLCIENTIDVVINRILLSRIAAATDLVGEMEPIIAQGLAKINELIITKEFTEAELLKREKEIEQRIEKAKQTREEFDEAMV